MHNTEFDSSSSGALAPIRSLLDAARETPSPQIRGFYLSRARNMLVAFEAEIAATAKALDEHESSLVRGFA